MQTYLLILTNHAGEELHRFADAPCVPSIGDYVTLPLGDYIVLNRKWGTTAKSFGVTVHVAVSKAVGL